MHEASRCWGEHRRARGVVVGTKQGKQLWPGNGQRTGVSGSGTAADGRMRAHRSASRRRADWHRVRLRQSGSKGVAHVGAHTNGLVWECSVRKEGGGGGRRHQMALRIAEQRPISQVPHKQDSHKGAGPQRARRRPHVSTERGEGSKNAVSCVKNKEINTRGNKTGMVRDNGRRKQMGGGWGEDGLLLREALAIQNRLHSSI